MNPLELIDETILKLLVVATFLGMIFLCLALIAIFKRNDNKKSEESSEKRKGKICIFEDCPFRNPAYWRKYGFKREDFEGLVSEVKKAKPKADDNLAKAILDLLPALEGEGE